MRSLCLFVVLAITVARAANAVGTPMPMPPDPLVGKQVPTFTADALDVSVDPPKVTKLESAKAKNVTAYIFVGTGCPATNAYAERFYQAVKTYKPKGIDFVFLYPNRDDTHEAKLNFHKSKELGGVLIEDQGGSLAHQFGAVRTTEIFLVDKSGKIVFHGGFDDSRDPGRVTQKFFTDAVDAQLAGKPIAVDHSQVVA